MESIRKRLGKNKADLDDLSSKEESPKTISRLQKFKNFLWNPEQKSVLGRNSLSWGKISLYYAIFYILLAAFFILLFGVFVTTLDRRFPTFYNKESVMDYKGVNPGMGFRPMPDITKNLINLGSPANNRLFFDSYKKYVEEFLVQNSTITNSIDCMTNTNKSLEAEQVCRYSYDSLVWPSHPCDVNLTTAGYDTGSPCIVIKLNRIIGWIPTPGNSTLDPMLPSDFVYFKCEGYQASDVDMFPNVTYYSMNSFEGNPNHGSLPYSYFPYSNIYDYIPPFVIVRFDRLPERYLLNVLCKAYAPNIDNKDTQNLRGMTHFQLFYNPSSEA